MKELLIRWENNTVAAKFINREFDDKFAVPGDKIGSTYNARVAPRFRGRKGDGIRPENIVETVVPITIDQLWGVDLDISDQDLTLTIDRFGERYLESASATLANNIDGAICDLYADVYNFSGTPGTTPADLTTYTAAGVALSNSATPSDSMRSVLVNPSLEAAALGFRSNLFNPVREVSQQYLTGKMGTAVGFKFSMDQNIASQSLGTLSGSTPVVNGAGQSGSSLITNGWANSTTVLKAGDIISVVAMNSVNPLSYRDTSSLRSFVVTQDVTSDGSGNATIPVNPPINFDTTSSFQTVVNAPPAGAAIKVYGVAAANFANISGIASPQALAFHKEAFALALVNMELPGGLDWSERVTDPKTGFTARLTRGFSMETNRRYTRFETLGGVKTIRPEFACRICA